MNCRVLAAGWPFAGLLALDADCAEVSATARVCGLVVASDEEGGILVLEPGDGSGRLAIGAATAFYGVDGYPIARGDIQVGATVEAVRQKVGAAWVATTVRLLRRAPGPRPLV